VTRRDILGGLPVLILLLCPTCASAGWYDSTEARDARRERRSLPLVVVDDGLNVLNAAAHTITSPRGWGEADWLRAGTVVLVGAGSSLLDHEMLRLLERNKSNGLDDAAKIAVRFGEGPAAILVGGMYVVGLAVDEPWLRETGAIAGGCILLSTGLTSMLKVVAGRARPLVGEGHGVFRPFTSDARYRSFPSGHASVAFSLAAVFAERIDNVSADIALYTLASVASVARMYRRHHWLSDVVFTALSTTAIAKSMVWWYDRKATSESRLSIEAGVAEVRLTYRL
jgi:hypothetical protein